VPRIISQNKTTKQKIQPTILANHAWHDQKYKYVIFSTTKINVIFLAAFCWSMEDDKQLL